MQPLRVAAVQFEHAPGDKKANLARIKSFVAAAKKQNVQLIAFPECCISSYMHLAALEYDQLVALADEVPGGESVKVLSGLAAGNGITVMAGLLEIEKEPEVSFYNTYVAVSPEGSVVRYRKLHPFVNKHLKPGNEFKFWEIEGWKVSCLICYDCNLWENWRIVELRGAQIVFCPHQTGGFDIPCAGMGKISPELWLNREKDPDTIRKEITGPKGLEWVKKWLPSRAYDTGTYVVFANGVGIDGEEVRTGGSMIINPHGIVLTETSALGDDMVVADLDPKELELNLGKSHTSARRPELYRELVKGAGAATKEKRDAIRKKLGVDLN